MEKMLEELQARDLDRLEAKKLTITEKVYPNLPEIIERTAGITGIPVDVLVRSCVSAARSQQNLTWYEVLDIVRYVWQAKKRIEDSQG